MIAALDALGLLVVLGIAVLFYRWLIHSRWFAGLVGSVTHPLPETSEEIISDLSHAEQAALERAELARRTAEQERNTVKTIHRHVRRKPTPF